MGMSQLHLWWKPGEVTGAARGMDSVPAIRKLWIAAGLRFFNTLLNHPFLKSPE